ncbi:hypothetical protein BDR05DRAFT_605533 [Suillus weaverae]|nr:hypothetical protein BDR05DRAFT_605533 [Suillus weaverae]
MTALFIAKGGRLWRHRMEFPSERACATIFFFCYSPLSGLRSPVTNLSIIDSRLSTSPIQVQAVKSLVGITTGRDRSPSEPLFSLLFTRGV